MTEFFRKAPTLLAIIALGWALILSLQVGIDSTFRISLVTALAGLGGFYLRDALTRRDGSP